MSKIVIDGRMINEAGIGRYLRNLIKELQVLDKENEYFILLRKKEYMDSRLRGNDSGGNFKKVLADFSWYGLTEQIQLPKVLNKIQPDLVHFPHFNVPIFYQGKFVVTIHDLIHQHFSFRRSTLHNPIIHRIKKIGYNQTFKYAVNESIKILTPSKSVKEQLIKEWSVKSEKINITAEGVDNDIIKLTRYIPKKIIDDTLLKFKIEKPYIFYVGNAHPHKNVEGLIKTFLEVRKNYQNLKLVLSGPDNFFWKRVKNKFKSKDIIYTGFISEDELGVLYKNATVFVQPSFEEGFGIPVLEAMAFGTPVVSSSNGSLKEVGGEAAIYFDPKNLLEMAEKIQQVLNSEKLQQELREKGLERVKDFSWKKLAEETLEIYNQCV